MKLIILLILLAPPPCVTVVNRDVDSEGCLVTRTTTCCYTDGHMDCVVVTTLECPNVIPPLSGGDR